MRGVDLWRDCRVVRGREQTNCTFQDPDPSEVQKFQTDEVDPHVIIEVTRSDVPYGSGKSVLLFQGGVLHEPQAEGRKLGHCAFPRQPPKEISDLLRPGTPALAAPKG
jgi:hypothetical protein